MLSDERFEWIEALSLPTFELAGTRFVKRITLVVRDGEIEKVFYPVFPPDGNAEMVAGWLRSAPENRPSPGLGVTGIQTRL